MPTAMAMRTCCRPRASDDEIRAGLLAAYACAEHRPTHDTLLAAIPASWGRIRPIRDAMVAAGELPRLLDDRGRAEDGSKPPTPVRRRSGRVRMAIKGEANRRDYAARLRSRIERAERRLAIEGRLLNRTHGMEWWKMVEATP